MKYIIALFTLLFLPAGNLSAADSPLSEFKPTIIPIELSLPVDCTIGEDCFIQKYVDMDPAEEGLWADYQCGHMSNDKHKGTDFRIRDYSAMDRGYNILAAADGIITATRDDINDINVNLLPEGSVNGNECGNGVVIDHKNGWKTQYCHMKKGSVIVAKDDVVKSGDVLGHIGLSGNTAFPHLHFTLYQEGKIITDPFTGAYMETGCGKEKNAKPLWDAKTRNQVMYLESVKILLSGFTNKVPPAEDARHGKHNLETISNKSPALILWAEVMGLKKHDIISLEIRMPNGRQLHKSDKEIGKAQARFFLYSGKSIKNIRQWPKGTYVGHIKVLREGAIIDEEHITIDVI